MEVAIVGGGRWGKVLCGVVAGLRQVRKIHLVSRRNARGMQDWLADQRLAHRVELHSKLDPVLWNSAIEAAIVANLPSEHFATARWLLENGKHVLVEHPFAQTRAEAQALVDLAEALGLVAATLSTGDGRYVALDYARDAPAPVAAEIACFLEATVERRGAPSQDAAGHRGRTALA
jgi:predicted dehydrogenase